MTRYFTVDGLVERRPITNNCEVCSLNELSIFHWMPGVRKGHEFVPHFKHHFKLIAVKSGPFELTNYVFECTTVGCRQKWMIPKWILFKRPRPASVLNMWNHDFERKFNTAQETLGSVFQDYDVHFDGRNIP